MMRLASLIGLVLVLAGLSGGDASAQSPVATADLGLGELTTSGVLRTVILLGLLAVIPTVFICTTAFIRIVVVLAMVRHAFGMPETPPNQVLIALGVFLTAYVMGPTFVEMNEAALQPLLAGNLDISEGLQLASGPLRDFMLTQVRDEDIAAIYAVTDTPLPTTPEEVDIFKLVPAFIINELRIAFTIGFVILLPFLLIDLVVASILLSLGMMMVPPITISLPIKVLMFVLIDGWVLVIQGLLGGF